MSGLATIEDVKLLWRPLSDGEIERATALIDVISDTLRLRADEVGKDIDQMVADSEVYASVVKSVVVDIVARTLLTSTTSEPLTQYSQSALGYSVSGTFLNPGGGLFIKRDELSRLGLKKQRYGVIEIYDTTKGNNCNFN